MDATQTQQFYESIYLYQLGDICLTVPAMPVKEAKRRSLGKDWEGKELSKALNKYPGQWLQFNTYWWTVSSAAWCTERSQHHSLGLFSVIPPGAWFYWKLSTQMQQKTLPFLNLNLPLPDFTVHKSLPLRFSESHLSDRNNHFSALIQLPGSSFPLKLT